ncbi:DUF167 domain-containing protein [Candidatus Micrarchaeota archaeon]|nr:DUF167 domain-containing protein [Candidatus Micrarchaeota archaeon]
MDFWVKVVPNAKDDRIKVSKKEITVYVKETAKNNKANLSIERFFSKVTHKPTRIISGFKRRRKKIHIEMDEQEFYNTINNYANA